MFHEFKEAIDQQWKAMGPATFFRTGIDKDLMWLTYLGSFPEGSNPLYRKRTEHDCSCCRQFIRAMGDVVTVRDGALVSIWDITTPNSAYAAVAGNMAALVRSRFVDNIFLHTEASAGTDHNHEQMPDGSVHTWEHFHVRLPNSIVLMDKDIGPKLADARAAHDVLWRGLADLPADPERNLTASKAITLEALDTVLELINANALYRGEEHKHAIDGFRAVKEAFTALPIEQRDNWVWSTSVEMPAHISRIRNTSIGTLLVELSEGMDLEAAVGRFERMVAPQNYRRPTALVTPSMIAKAKATVEELGLMSALERRYAHITDITVNNVIFADRSARKAMAGGVFDDLASAATVKPGAFDKVQEVSAEEFIATVLHGAESVELLMENRHAGNLVSLIAPVDPQAGRLFAWENGFSWSYAGDVADAVKERVKQAGGNVTGDLCCRLAWSNRNDLDLHMNEPTGHIYFGSKLSAYTGGQLDIDMNVRGETRTPVENIFYETERTMKAGVYWLSVHCYTKREAIDGGFQVDIDWKGTVYRLAYPKAVRSNETVQVARMLYTPGKGIEILDSIQIAEAVTQSRKLWGIDTQAFHRVSTVMFSPNHWDGHGVGNKHYFFMLPGAQNDGTARGFYNEFLRGDLAQHRKAFELVGSKMRTEADTNQLSGLGFASTARNHVVARVKGGIGTRTVRVAF